ncbi:MAG: signal transduction histidine kinase/CheY-like chemotaxis protein [Candidatus Azotimanducaceae bacterium]|jgi:signal transduction histidine kinase/CheY-like chemotaxis protein
MRDAKTADQNIGKNGFWARLLRAEKKTYLLFIAIAAVLTICISLLPLFVPSNLNPASLFRPTVTIIGSLLILAAILPTQIVEEELENRYIPWWEHTVLAGLFLCLLQPAYTLGGAFVPTSGLAVVIFLLAANVLEQSKNNRKFDSFSIMKISLVIAVSHILLLLLLELLGMAELMFLDSIGPLGNRAGTGYLRGISLVGIGMGLAVTNSIIEARQYIRLSDLALRAESAKTAESRFLSNMSHEIRNPMNNLMGMLQVMKESKDLSDDDKESLFSALHASDQVRHLLDDILDYEIIRSGKYKLELSPFDFSECINQLGRQFAILSKQKGIDFVINGVAFIPQYFIGDVSKLEQIMNNIVGNAVKFTNEGGVTIDLTYQDGRLSCIVTDTGIGMTAKTKETIFKRFSRGDDNMHRDLEGAGLGLSITKEIINLWNGTISMASELGQGSTITIDLPITEVESNEDIARYLDEQITDSKPLNESAVATHLEEKQLTALIVDDQKPNLRVLARLLALIDVTTVQANSGADALRLLSQSSFDFVISDINMPEMSGIELLERIRLSDPELPVIALSGNVMKDDVEQYLSLGFDMVLGKPIKQDELKKAIVHLE